jgi:hypothetical protein
LSDCHRRIEKFLEQIIRVCTTARGGELNAGQREALEVALRYFRQAAPLHTADEETSLFPRVRERAQNGDATNAIQCSKLSTSSVVSTHSSTGLFQPTPPSMK